MVFSAFDATTFTNNSITETNSTELQGEIDLAERAIRNAANRQKFTVAYNARTIGNPVSGIQDGDGLTTQQIAFRDALTAAGYLVTIDALSGFWGISWSAQDVELLVSIYSVRTIVAPGAISELTITAINDFFGNQSPVVTSTTTLVNVSDGADTDEQDFGGAISAFYEYVAVVRQQDPTTDLSSTLRDTLAASGLGYSTSPSNVFAYKLR